MGCVRSGELGEGRPDFGGREPKGEVLGKKRVTEEGCGRRSMCVKNADFWESGFIGGVWEPDKWCCEVAYQAYAPRPSRCRTHAQETGSGPYDWLAGEWGCGPLVAHPWPTFQGRVDKTFFTLQGVRKTLFHSI